MARKMRPHLNHDFLEFDTNAAERALRPVAPARINFLFVRSESGGKTATIADHKITRPDELMP